MVIPFEIRPRGRFSLAAAQRFLGGFTPAGGTFADRGTSLAMAFPIDGWDTSAGAVVWQDGETVLGRASGPNGTDVDPALVAGQVARTLSLDHDGRGWDDVGDRIRSSAGFRPSTTISAPSVSTRRTRRRSRP